MGELVPEKREEDAPVPGTVPGTEPVADVVEELEEAEEVASAEVEVEASPEAPAIVAEPADPDADRINFEDALSPRRGAISAGTPSLDESEPEGRSAPPR